LKERTTGHYQKNLKGRRIAIIVLGNLAWRMVGDDRVADVDSAASGRRRFASMHRAIGLDHHRCSEALGVTRNTLSELVNGKRGISPEMAVRLSKVFGGTDQGSLVQQAHYDLAQVRRYRLKLERLELA
jgi:addiction module HigA family antidote